MKSNFFLSFFVMCGCLSLQAQTIHLEFPYFAGKTYDFTIFQGEKCVTLRQDTIPKGGRIQLTIPEQYKDYAGMAKWYLTNNVTGGGLDLIINNEDFSVSCLDSIPTEENILYRNSTENRIDKLNYKRQQLLFQKHDALLATIRSYAPSTKLHKLAAKEYNKILKDYEDYSKGLSKSHLYSAKFRQIVNLTMGIGTIITPDENKKAANINDFITNDLDFEVLYTSNHWNGIINNWVQLQGMVIKDEAKMIADATTILSRIKTNAVYTDFVGLLTKQLSRNGKDNAIALLVPVIKASNRLLHYDGVLQIYKLELSNKTLDLIIKPSFKNLEKTIRIAELNAQKTILLFYESGCGHCQAALTDLKSNYQELTAKGIRVVTLASDTSEDEFTKNTTGFPWPDNYCDLEGMQGINFKNYGILGTPTLVLLDAEGKIEQKTAVLREIMEAVK